jgi:hypothetical protein
MEKDKHRWKTGGNNGQRRFHPQRPSLPKAIRVYLSPSVAQTETFPKPILP